MYAMKIQMSTSYVTTLVVLTPFIRGRYHDSMERDGEGDTGQATVPDMCVYSTHPVQSRARHDSYTLKYIE